MTSLFRCDEGECFGSAKLVVFPPPAHHHQGLHLLFLAVYRRESLHAVCWIVVIVAAVSGSAQPSSGGFDVIDRFKALCTVVGCPIDSNSSNCV